MRAVNSNFETTELLENTSDIESLRAKRIFQIARVAWATWLFFAIFCMARGYHIPACVCFSEFCLINLIITAYRERTNYRQLMNIILGVCSVGLFINSCAEPALGYSMLFFPISILIASQLLGIKDALIWMFVSLSVNIAYLLTLNFVGRSSHFDIDEMALISSVNVCIFFCCQQGEVLYRERTNGLVKLSKSLRKEAERLRRLATTDSLTGLFNRFKFQQDLDEQIALASDESKVGLIVVDLDGFKEVNDTLGHPVGDGVLVTVAESLEREFSKSAIVARLGGDEFGLIIPDLTCEKYASSIAEKVCTSLEQRYEIDGCQFPLGASVGIAIAPQDSADPNELLAFADTAMYYAKENRLGFTRYEPEMTNQLVRFRSTREKLADALDQNEFFLVYQPQVSVDGGHVIGVEALLRWKHNGEVISPGRFIPLLESSQAIIPVGNWILRECCRQLREWNDLGLHPEMSINLSSVQLTEADLASSVARLVDEFAIDARQLDFEITESLLVEDVETTIQQLSELKKVGASISIDDFGTGYSSLAYLRQFPIDRLKIDRTFIKDFPDSDNGMIAASIVALAHALGLKVIAEGVETTTQLEFIKSRACDEYQGFLFSRPISADQVTVLMKRELAICRQV